MHERTPSANHPDRDFAEFSTALSVTHQRGNRADGSVDAHKVPIPPDGIAVLWHGIAMLRGGIAVLHHGIAISWHGIANPCAGIANWRHGIAVASHGIVIPPDKIVIQRDQIAFPRDKIVFPPHQIASVHPAIAMTTVVMARFALPRDVASPHAFQAKPHTIVAKPRAFRDGSPRAPDGTPSHRSVPAVRCAALAAHRAVLAQSLPGSRWSPHRFTLGTHDTIKFVRGQATQRIAATGALLASLAAIGGADCRLNTGLKRPPK